MAVQYGENLQACRTIADEFQYDYKWLDILHNINDYRPVTLEMHFAIHGHTAAELIVERANSTKEHMGLITWAF